MQEKLEQVNGLSSLPIKQDVYEVPNDELGTVAQPQRVKKSRGGPRGRPSYASRVSQSTRASSQDQIGEEWRSVENASPQQAISSAPEDAPPEVPESPSDRNKGDQSDAGEQPAPIQAPEESEYPHQESIDADCDGSSSDVTQESEPEWGGTSGTALIGPRTIWKDILSYTHKHASREEFAIGKTDDERGRPRCKAEEIKVLCRRIRTQMHQYDKLGKPPKDGSSVEQPSISYDFERHVEILGERQMQLRSATARKTKLKSSRMLQDI